MAVQSVICVYATAIGSRVKCRCPALADGKSYLFVPPSRCQRCPHATSVDPDTKQPAKPSGCVYLGPVLANAPCSTCGGAATVPVMACSVWGEVIQRRGDRQRLLAPQSLEGEARERQLELAGRLTCDMCFDRTTIAYQDCLTWTDRQAMFETNGADWLAFRPATMTLRNVISGNVGAIYEPDGNTGEEVTAESLEWHGHCPTGVILYRRSALAAVGAFEFEPGPMAHADWYLLRKLLRAGWRVVRE